MSTERDLIQRLANALNEWQLGNAPPEDTSDVDLINEADAYLAQPEPEGLTDEELETDFLCWYKDRYSTAYFGAVPLAVLIAWTQFALARWGRLSIEPEPDVPTDEELHDLWLELYGFHPDGPTSGDVAVIARAVLARWGRPATEPETNGKA